MLDDVIAMAAGRKEPELLLTNVRVLNVFSGDLETTHVAVGQGVIVGMGREYAHASRCMTCMGNISYPA
jgi:adenine deaminase